MSDTATNPTHPPLGAAQLVTDTFALLFSNFLLFMAITLVPSLGLSALQQLILPGALAAGGSEARLLWGGLIAFGVAILVGLLIMGSVTMAAYDTRLGRPVRLGAYARRTLAAAPAIVVLGVLMYLGVMVGVLFFIVPGLYLAARYWVMVPAILLEGAGFSGLSRAARLSKGYRWPILGALALLFILVALIGLALTVLFAALLGTGMFTAADRPNYPLVVFLDAINGAAQYALLSIFTALLYARLRELKEGLGMEDLVSVFE